MTTGARIEVCVVGAGPRGLSVLERLCANERAEPTHPEVTIHVVDPASPGSGAVWRREQSRHLLMNTVASQITVYTDASSRIEGPIVPGPSLHEWARSLSVLGEPGDHGADILAEARSLGPDDYPTRAFYGRYLHDAFRQVVARAPAHVAVRVHRSRAVALADIHGVPGGPQGIRLADGTRLHDLDAVVLALGHLPARLSAREARTASLARIHYLTYITPANPADLDLGRIRPGENVLLRGLGLNFFDHMALFTIGRDGRFGLADNGRTVYHPSGNEPMLYASSRRGVPYRARGENQKGATGRYVPRLLTPAYVEGLRRRAREGRPVDFTTDLWPPIAREVESVYYAALLRLHGRDAEGEGFIRAYLTADADHDVAALLDAYAVAPADRWDWVTIARPYGDREFASRPDFTRWLVDYLSRDVAAARAGNVDGPLKAALDVLRDLRNEIRLAVDHGGLDGNSHRDDLEGWYTPLNGFLSIGPPAARIEQMIALIEAGVLTLTGPGTRICLDVAEPAFVAASTVVPGPPVRARVLIEARLPEPDLRRTEDPLLQHLLNTDQAAPYRIAGAGGEDYETGGLAVTERPYRLIDGRGRAHPRRFAYGVPTESVHWVTAAGIRPGVDSVTLADSDAIARAVLSLPAVSRVPANVRRVPADDADVTANGVIV
ncbi:FAD/NAD(P)-binding protein [Embleya sp. NBC_00896]|uniref:FAD/NAD(P)-binding protein n=1 Tax=Embleya sp. NBC_00896 TaxID=2975961 RepID=UPI0038643095|nr:FAD/NAD(P)-binding protein [Embleya sp. NBC_00896]